MAKKEAAVKERVISIKNVQAITEVELPILEEGGVIEFLGDNGSGKSTALDAVKALMKNGDPNLTCRDGTLKGTVSGFGATLTISKRKSHSGQLTIEGIDGGLNVGTIIDPGIKDVLSADAKRIKALLGVSGLTPNTKSFLKIFRDEAEFLKVVDQAKLASATDYVEMATRIKLDLDKAARTAEQKAADLQKKADAKRAGIENVDIADAKPAEHYQAEYESAVREKARLEAVADEVEKATERFDEAQRKLNESASSEESSEAIAPEITRGVEELDKIVKQIESLQDEQAALQKKLVESEHEHDLLVQKFKLAKQHEEQRAEWEATIQAAMPALLPEEKLEEAEQAVKDALESMERGAIARKAIESIEEADSIQADADWEAAIAEHYREAAKKTDDVLSSLITNLGHDLFVQDGRLVTKTPKRGDTLFGDLSPGESATLAIDIVVDCMDTVKPDRDYLLVIDQPVWESMDQSNREKIRDKVRERKVSLVTGRCASGELRAEVMA